MHMSESRANLGEFSKSNTALVPIQFLKAPWILVVCQGLARCAWIYILPLKNNPVSTETSVQSLFKNEISERAKLTYTISQQMHVFYDLKLLGTLADNWKLERLVMSQNWWSQDLWFVRQRCCWLHRSSLVGASLFFSSISSTPDNMFTNMYIHTCPTISWHDQKGFYCEENAVSMYSLKQPLPLRCHKKIIKCINYLRSAKNGLTGCQSVVIIQFFGGGVWTRIFIDVLYCHNVWHYNILLKIEKFYIYKRLKTCTI